MRQNDTFSVLTINLGSSSFEQPTAATIVVIVAATIKSLKMFFISFSFLVLSFISHLSSQRTLPPPTGTPSTLEGEFLYSSSSKLEEVSRSDGGVCLSLISHLSSLIFHLSSFIFQPNTASLTSLISPQSLFPQNQNPNFAILNFIRYFCGKISRKIYSRYGFYTFHNS